MRKQLVAIYLIASSVLLFSRNVTVVLAQRHVSSAAQPKTVPSVKQAIIKAIVLSKGQNLFNQQESIRNYNAIEISGLKEANGSVKVVFSAPTSTVIVKDGRLARKKIFEVTFARNGVTSKSFKR